MWNDVALVFSRELEATAAELLERLAGQLATAVDEQAAWSTGPVCAHAARRLKVRNAGLGIFPGPDPGLSTLQNSYRKAQKQAYLGYFREVDDPGRQAKSTGYITQIENPVHNHVAKIIDAQYAPGSFDVALLLLQKTG
ncbi:hypothetical protein [Streptomyces sp. NPDC001774]